jgi:hypothetical protein
LPLNLTLKAVTEDFEIDGKVLPMFCFFLQSILREIEDTRCLKFEKRWVSQNPLESFKEGLTQAKNREAET